ncbi:Small integral membrane protein [Bosea sp. LC85]|uniref:DUF1328 family protein n=1 Tax=Bosea sp. LC85 TaxID=1502851 RepID=UPI0004E35338|nr:DUF1328 family protein [Bosea sp. LC85]KFC70894.1 Small integral membrane protein [Bosea sp. LC85]
MSGWTVTFLIAALVAGMPAFGGVPGLAMVAARIVFFAALVAAAVTGLIAMSKGRRS